MSSTTSRVSPPSEYGDARQTECHDVTARGADLDRIDAQHAVAIRGRVGFASAVPVVGENDEVESGPRRGGRDVIDRAGSIRTSRMNVNRSAHRRAQRRGRRQECARQNGIAM